MDAKNVGGLIVKDGEQVVGIITERDYLRKVILRGRSSKETAVDSIMTRDLMSITPEHTVAEAMKIMTEKRCRHLPVFKDGQLDGILSIGDLVKTIHRKSSVRDPVSARLHFRPVGGKRIDNWQESTAGPPAPGMHPPPVQGGEYRY